MLRILGLSALGLFLLAASSSAQQPATVSGPSSAPVVQTVTSGGPTYSNRRFGLFRGNGRFSRRYYTPVTTTSQAMVDTTTTQTGTQTTTTKPEQLPAPKSGTTPAATDAPVYTTTTTTEPTSNRRFLRRNGGFLSRLGSRFGRY
jgi:hypothetical protein